MKKFRYIHTNGQNHDFVELCRLLDQNLDEIVGTEFQREQYTPFNTLEDIHNVVIIYENDRPVGGGGIKKFDDAAAEVKRVFVIPEYRGLGLSSRLMCELEEMARRMGFKKMILETGAPLLAAMGLYKSLGYRIIDNYGQYKDMEASICMEKMLNDK